jgi:hypothetical protein
MVNNIRTPRLGTTVASRRIAEAVDDEGWQRFRVSMKGKPTEEKLSMLRSYYNRAVDADLELHLEKVKIRVDNYIKALCRGGQLKAGASLKMALAVAWKLQVQK